MLEGDHHDPSEPEVPHTADEKIHGEFGRTTLLCQPKQAKHGLCALVVVTREEFEEELEGQDPAPVPEPVRLTADDAQRTAAKAEDKGKQAEKEVKSKANETANKAEKKGEEVKEEAKAAGSEAKKEAQKVGEEAKQSLNKAGTATEKKAEEAKQELSKAGKEAEKKYEKGKEEAKREYDELSDKAKKAYNKMSAEAQKDWDALSAESKKRWAQAKDSDVGQELQKPEVWGSLLAVSNLAVIGTVGWFAYTNWQKPRWDRRVVSATVIGVASWFGLQGYAQISAIR